MSEMPAPRTTVDGSGRLVRVGALVRILQIPEYTRTALPQAEADRVLSMLGEVLEVYEVDEAGQAWVEKEWDEGEGHSSTHSLGLEPAQMVLVAQNGA